jgi:hypothetical protein
VRVALVVWDQVALAPNRQRSEWILLWTLCDPLRRDRSSSPNCSIQRQYSLACIVAESIWSNSLTVEAHHIQRKQVYL